MIYGRQLDHHQEASIVEPSFCESIKEPLEEELHSQFLIDDNLSQYPTYPNMDSDLDHITAKEEKVEINKASIEEQSCGHIVVKDQVCEDRNEHSDVFPYQMNDIDDHLSLVECNKQSQEEQPHDDDMLVSELDLEPFLSHLSNWNLCPDNHQELPRNDSCNIVTIPRHTFLSR